MVLTRVLQAMSHRSHACLAQAVLDASGQTSRTPMPACVPCSTQGCRRAYGPEAVQAHRQANKTVLIFLEKPLQCRPCLGRCA